MGESMAILHYGPKKIGNYYGALCKAPVGDLAYISDPKAVTCEACKTRITKGLCPDPTCKHLLEKHAPDGCHARYSAGPSGTFRCGCLYSWPPVNDEALHAVSRDYLGKIRDNKNPTTASGIPVAVERDLLKRGLIKPTRYRGEHAYRITDKGIDMLDKIERGERGVIVPT